jgi:hypothetical protein
MKPLKPGSARPREETAMNRVFDERLEQQLQEYEFAELDQLMPNAPLMHAIPRDKGNTPDTPPGVSLQYKL